MKEVKNMNYENNINKILKEERIRAGISIRELAKLAGVSPTTICEIEKDTFGSLEELPRQIEALNLQNPFEIHMPGQSARLFRLITP